MNLTLTLLSTSDIIHTIKYSKREESLMQKQEGECAADSRHFPRSIDIVAWPMQRKFSRRRKFQKSCNERGDVKGKLGLVY